jgi:hypothetical protein
MSPVLETTQEAYVAILAEIVWPVAVAWQRLLDAVVEDADV